MEASAVVMWIFTIILLICVLAMSGVLFFGALEKENRFTRLMGWNTQNNNIKVNKKLALVLSVAAIISLLGSIITGIASKKTREGFVSMMM